MESLYFHRVSVRPLARGFTLIELMVVLAIITTITSVVFTSQGSFNKTLILGSTAYDIALSLRSAQSRGLGSRALIDASGGLVSERTGYGLHFVSGSPTTFVLFADTSPAVSCDTPDCKPGDYVYTSGSDSLLQTYTIGNGMGISNFCSFANGSWSCATNGGITALDIVFVRPSPNPFMSVNGAYSPAFPVTKACLTVAAPQGGTKFISIMSSGQIVANAPSDPSSCHE
ncbi:MAG: type II secretion system GspH family protein [Patescibacteria group bacterium]|nr:type II secretion system GspH family protein [Patescibacteria group bacterium]